MRVGTTTQNAKRLKMRNDSKRETSQNAKRKQNDYVTEMGTL